MKAKIITLRDNKFSVAAVEKALASSEKVGNGFTVEVYDAITPEMVDDKMKEHRLTWNYPSAGEEYDIKSGLKKAAYMTARLNKRIGCFLSHYEQWKQCAESGESMIVLEHDALFTNKVEVDMLEESSYNIIGLNNPKGATRRASLFDQQVKQRPEGVVSCPKVDLDHVPQGLAGNSAYYIKPEGAKKMLELVNEFGAWPNDAIMCRQLLGGKLGVTNPYYTKVQGLVSTTSL
jgi:GR25 family glycosyltransferase involved in LPS biosynthesis